jgi:hypothetical protein
LKVSVKLPLVDTTIANQNEGKILHR